MREVVPIAALACVLALGACGSSEHATPHETIHDLAPVESSATPEAVDAASSAMSAAEPVADVDAGTSLGVLPDLGPIDHRATPCFTDLPATSFAGAPFRHPSGPFEAVVRTSVAPGRLDQLHVRPATTVRFDVTMENVGTVDIVLGEIDVEALRRLSVMGLSASWIVPIDAVTPLAAGQHLAPGAMLRLCAAFEVPRTPIDAAPPHELQRVYTLNFANTFLVESRVYFQIGGATIVVTYPPSSGRSRREADSWGGVIRAVLRPDASVTTIARETGVRVGSGVPLFAGRSIEPRSGVAASREAEVFFEAPTEMSVADGVAALARRADVLHAAAVRRGDPGTEGCSANSPCAAGEQCCYMCGIPGCANSCYRGRSCPRGIP